MDNLISNYWNTLCKSATANAEKLAEVCHQEANAAAMREAAERFCNQQPPKSRQDLQAVSTRHMSLSAHLTAIARADAMIHAFPKAKDRILAEVKKLSADDFADDGDSFVELQRRHLELVAAISAICFQVAQI